METKHKFHAGEVTFVAPGDKVVLVAPQYTIDLLNDMNFVEHEVHMGSIITVSEVRKETSTQSGGIWSEDFKCGVFLPYKWFAPYEEDEAIDIGNISELYGI